MVFFIPCVCDKIKKINGCHNTNDQVTTLLVILLDLWSDTTCPDEHNMIKWSLFDSVLRNIQITIHINNYFQFFLSAQDLTPQLSMTVIYSSNCPSIHPSIHPPTHTTTHPSIHPSTYVLIAYLNPLSITETIKPASGTVSVY